MTGNPPKLLRCIDCGEQLEFATAYSYTKRGFLAFPLCKTHYDNRKRIGASN